MRVNAIVRTLFCAPTMLLLFALIAPVHAAKARAVSMRVLQSSLMAVADASYPEQLRQLTGISRLSGYIVDKENKDIVLLGTPRAGVPDILVEDIVVALRNSWLVYAEQKGTTILYSSVGCSIDPTSQTMAQLQKVAPAIFRVPVDKRSEHIQKWHDVCEQPQGVRVLGIPFDCHFAQVLVTADYDMKRLADGADSLDIEGFASVTHYTFEQAQQLFMAGKGIPGGVSLNRFWFYPGEVSFVDQGSAVFVKSCPVQLLTEAKFVSLSGQSQGSGREDPLAQEFASDFTEKYDAVAQARPIYAEVSELFRVIAVVKALKFRVAFGEAGLDIDWLLKSYVVPETKVPVTLPGRSRYVEAQYRRELPDRVQEMRMSMPSCGGVSIDMKVSGKSFSKARTDKAVKTVEAVKKARPTAQSLSWDVEVPE